MIQNLKAENNTIKILSNLLIPLLKIGSQFSITHTEGEALAYAHNFVYTRI